MTDSCQFIWVRVVPSSNRKHRIMNLKHFTDIISTRNCSIPSPFVLNKSSRFYLFLRCMPAKIRRSIHASNPIIIDFISLCLWKDLWKPRMYWFVYSTIVSKIEEKEVSTFKRCWCGSRWGYSTPGNFRTKLWFDVFALFDGAVLFLLPTKKI